MTPKEWQDIDRTLNALVPNWAMLMNDARVRGLNRMGTRPTYSQWVAYGEMLTILLYVQATVGEQLRQRGVL